MYRLIADNPYRFTSGDVIFDAFAERNDIAQADRAAARDRYYCVPRPCLRSSDLGQRYGWGIHADADSRLAVFGVGSDEYQSFTVGRTDLPITLVQAMRNKRAESPTS